MEKALESIYYDSSKVGSFSGYKSLFQEAKKVDSKIKLKDVKNFLASQEAYTLHKDIKFKFSHLKTRSKGPNQYWQMDLSDLSRYSSHNDGHKFILFIIDVHTRYLWGYALKNKKPSSVCKVLENLILNEGTQPAYIWCDKGNEFIGGCMKKLVNDLHIGIIHTYGISKAGIVERVQRTIKRRMHRYFTYANTYKYVDILQKLILSYNNSYHKSIKGSPSALYRVGKPLDLAKRTKSYTIVDKRLKVGAAVRISRVNRLFIKGFHKGWSTEIFTIHRIVRRFELPIFYLKDLNGEELEGGFYEKEIQFVTKPEGGMYKIEKILKTIGKGRKKQHLVKWEGYPSSFNSYVKAIDISTS